jgi:hypothetical protein
MVYRPAVMGKVTGRHQVTQILESPHMKMFYRKLPKTASLTFICHPLRTLLDFLVSSSFLRKRDSLNSRLSSDVIVEKNNRFLDSWSTRRGTDSIVRPVSRYALMPIYEASRGKLLSRKLSVFCQRVMAGGLLDETVFQWRKEYF